MAVVLKSFDLSASVGIAALKTGIGEAEVLMLAAAHAQVLFSSADLSLEAAEGGSQAAILAQFCVSSAGQVSFV